MRAPLLLTAVILLAVTSAGCSKEESVPACGLHSASKPVLLLSEKGDKDRALGVGAKLYTTDRVKSEGWALLECFGGALSVMDSDTLKVGELKAAHIEATNLPRKKLNGLKLDELTAAMPRTVVGRYTDSRFTPDSAFAKDKPTTTSEYFVAFFTPNGIEKMTNQPLPDGPRALPPPPNRVRVPHIHAADLGEGGPLLEVTDDVVFAETDDLATAALLEDKTYQLGRTVRLVVPKGAEATLKLPDGKVKLEGPLDLTLR